MLDVHESTTPIPFEPSTIDLRSDAEIDALPFGVIALDGRGVVLRYNLYESRLARLDRSQVIGRDFFNEVARCARHEAFEGRFKRMVAGGASVRPERFEYTFDFAFGAQDVTIEMMRTGGAPRIYMFVNRTRLKPPRPSFPKEDLGVAQAVLAPDERSLGVRRDAVERRIVEVEWSMLSALRATCDRLAPDSWTLFCSEWGVAWGRRLAVDLESAALEQHGKNLGEVPMSAFAALVEGHLRERGWGHVELDFGDAARGFLAVRVARSALAESARPSARSTGVGAFACPLLAGCLGAALSHVAQRRIVVREVECAACGAARCEMVAVAAPRRAALDAAVASGTRGIEATRAALLAASSSTSEETPASDFLAML